MLWNCIKKGPLGQPQQSQSIIIHEGRVGSYLTTPTLTRVVPPIKWGTNVVHIVSLDMIRNSPIIIIEALIVVTQCLPETLPACISKLFQLTLIIYAIIYA